MSKQAINIGSVANDNTGDTLRAGGDKINDNFAELYGALGNGVDLQLDISNAGSGQVLRYNGTSFVADDISVLTAFLDVNGNSIISSGNGNITFTPNGTGDVVISNGGITNTFDGASGEIDLPTKVRYKNEYLTLSSAPTAANYPGYFFTVDGDDRPYVNMNITAGGVGNTRTALLTQYSSIGELNNVDISTTPPNVDQILKWDGTNWVPSDDAGAAGGGGGGGGVSSYSTLANFPAANVAEGSLVYAADTKNIYYSNGVSWTSQKLVTTNSSTTSDFSTLLANTQLTYNIDIIDHVAGTASENNARKVIRLGDSNGNTDEVVLVAGSGLSISNNGDEVQFDVNAQTVVTLGTEVAPGNTNSKLRLSDNNLNTISDITFAGADGLIVERTDATTLTFRAPAGASGGGSYTAEDAQDAAALLFSNGNHTGITFTYDDNNNSIDATVTVSGGGGGGTTYDLLGSNTTSNNAIITLRDAGNNDDSIELAGSGGTDITWDAANSKIIVNSTAPVQSDWNASSGLAQILNKPSIPPAYTLPAATTSALGGVIPDGTTITVDANGNIAAAPGGYVLPTAAAGTLGGVKIGSGLSIDGNGVVTATGGSTVPQIQDIAGTTALLADDATGELNITGYKAYTLFKIETDAAAWVRVYTDDTSRDADQTRSEGADPSPGSGVIAEVRTTTAESVLITPGIMGFNNDDPRTTTIYLSVTNRSGSASTVTVTLTALQIGD